MKQTKAIIFFEPSEQIKPGGEKTDLSIKRVFSPSDFPISSKCPHMIFRLPVLYKTAFPVLVIVPQAEGGFMYIPTPLKVNECQNLKEFDDGEGYWFEGALAFEAHSWTVEAALCAAEMIHKPLMECPTAAHKLADVRNLAPDYYFRKIDTRGKVIPQAQEQLFIAMRWDAWERKQ